MQMIHRLVRTLAPWILVVTLVFAVASCAQPTQQPTEAPSEAEAEEAQPTEPEEEEQEEEMAEEVFKLGILGPFSGFRSRSGLASGPTQTAS